MFARTPLLQNSRIGDVARVQMGYSFRSRLEPEPLGELLVIQMKDIDEAARLRPEGAVRVSMPNNVAQHLLSPGDLVLRSRGQTYTAAMLESDVGPAVLAAPLILIRPQPPVAPRYLLWFLNAAPTQAEFEAMARGTSVQMINLEAVKGVEVPVPPVAVQHQIAEAADLAQREQDLMGAIAHHRRRMVGQLLMQHARKAQP